MEKSEAKLKALNNGHKLPIPTILPEESLNKWMAVAVKNQDSSLLINNDNAILLIERGDLKFRKIFDSLPPIQDAVYVKHKNAYFLTIGGILYRKDVDGRPPYPFFQSNFSWKPGFRTLRYSERLQRLFCNTWKNIIVINLSKKKIESTLPKTVQENIGSSITNFLVLDLHSPKILIFDHHGWLTFFNFFNKVEKTAFCAKRSPPPKQRAPENRWQRVDRWRRRNRRYRWNKQNERNSDDWWSSLSMCTE